MRTYFLRTPKWLQLLFSEATWSIPEDQGVLWTFDDGPHPESTIKWLDELDAHGQSAIFFVNGRQALEYPDLVEEIRRRGHLVGSHGMDHLNGWKTKSSTYFKDVEESLDLLETRLFRPPYGKLRIGQYLKLKRICDLYYWTMMPGDFDEGIDRKHLLNRGSFIRKGDIVVLHDNPGCFQKSTGLIDQVNLKMKG